MQKLSYLKSVNAEYIDEVFERYSKNPESVDETWRYFFEGLELGTEVVAEEASALDLAFSNGTGAVANGAVPGYDTKSAAASSARGANAVESEIKVIDLIFGYRERGKWLAQVDPLTAAPSAHPSLELSSFGLSSTDLAQNFAAGRLLGLGTCPLSQIIDFLKATYCRSIAVEISHIQDPVARDWIQKRIESVKNREEPDAETRKSILQRLTQSESFERFLHTRYVGVKRFSIEGGESVISGLDSIFDTGTELGADEFVLGMAHRGRLNVLTTVCGKPLEAMLTEFEGNYHADLSHGEGDVKYHKGYSTDLQSRKGAAFHLSLANNPSHLEFVNPVVEGMARAKQRRKNDEQRTRVVPVLIHGDAAFAGQGVCYETLNFVKLKGYATGGTIHYVINNQVGFTADPDEGRSTPYCTDVAKMLDAPIFHVNGDDAEAVWYLSKVAMEYRQKFKSDVFIDIVCYRKYGHNEGDEPLFTQPLLYKKIKTHATPREVYAQKLAQAGIVSEADAQSMLDRCNDKLIQAQVVAKGPGAYQSASVFQGAWKEMHEPESDEMLAPVKTGVEKAKLVQLAEQINTIPGSFKLNSKLGRFFEARLKAVHDGHGLDWGNAETLAYASLVDQGYSVRLSGQDAGRGTFTHRHAALHDADTGEVFVPLSELARSRKNSSIFEVYNSHLSETGVLGFEYGYASVDPKTLTIWEAQFGDFANGAQVIIDQFIATGESKWQRMNGIVLLLPHGYEGQGPEHSSARLERFLQLSGLDNMSVVNLTTPAQIFHALRRQMIRGYRKPLVVMSPKSLLRLAAAVSTVDDLATGRFMECIDDAEIAKNAKFVSRVLMCSGKVYYDLLNERATRKLGNTAIVRVEQLYPWPGKMLAEILDRYPVAKDFAWVQEEPRNMGAWTHVFNQWMGGLGDFSSRVKGRALRYVGRDVGSSPAVGSPKIHETQLRALLDSAFKE